MLRIALVDDDKESLALLKGYITDFCRENGECARVECFNDGIDIVSDYTAEFDVIFLDTAMKHMDGLSAAAYIRKKDKNALIVLVSKDAHYAIKGYTVEAFSFLLKPINYFTFSREFARCIKKIKNLQGKYILFSTENGIDRIPVDKIVYIESQNHKMIVNTTEKPYVVYDTMKSLESKLPKNFSRCNNCYLVNLAFANGVHGEYVLISGEELKISRSRRKTFLEDIAGFYA